MTNEEQWEQARLVAMVAHGTLDDYDPPFAYTLPFRVKWEQGFEWLKRLGQP